MAPDAVRLLVVSSADSSNTTRALAVHNIAALWGLRAMISSQWVFVAYDGLADRWADVTAAARLLDVDVTIVSNDAPAAFTPKLAMQLRGWDAVSSASQRDAWDAVWLLDDDMWLGDPNSALGGPRAFLIRWACAFRAGPPLVAQPVVRGLQQFWTFNWENEWQPGGRVASTGAVALHTAFVEQQLPLFDARFFGWFAEEVGRQLAALQITHHTDLGTDMLWCGAAARYAADHAAGRVACAVVPVPFEHRGLFDRRSTLHQARGKQRGHAPASYWKGGAAVRERAATRWPQYWLEPQMLSMYKLSSQHVEESKRLPQDVCMVRTYASDRLGPACTPKQTQPRAANRRGASKAAREAKREANDWEAQRGTGVGAGRATRRYTPKNKAGGKKRAFSLSPRAASR